MFRDGVEPDDAMIRLTLYRNEIKSFLRHPFIGNILFACENFSNNSGHSTILDILSGYGLVLAIPIFRYLIR